MTLYRYRCDACGPFDARYPMGAAPRERECRGCGAAARRVFTAPGLAAPRTAVSRLRDAAEASAHEPAVVRRSPEPDRRPRPAAPADPRWARLPRP